MSLSKLFTPKMTTTLSFDQFVDTQDARNTLHLNVRKWSLMLCDALTHDAPDDYRYEIVSGNKYYKVVMFDSGGHKSVHCFVDKQTGEVYKSASYKAPAKGIRFDLRLIKDREWLFANVDWSGSYLYK